MSEGAPLVIDLFCGLGGWADGFLAEGYEVHGYDIEAHDYGTGGYPGTLILRDVRTIHGSELKDATCIVGSSPCQEFSYRAMPWKRAKALPPPYLGMELFQHQFRIQREASEAAGRHIPMVVENVKGAQPWVGKAAWHYGSFYLWGDVPALMPKVAHRKLKTVGPVTVHQAVNHNCHINETRDAFKEGVKFCQSGAAWFDGKPRNKMLGHFGPAAFGSKSNARKAASAMIAKIPFDLAVWIARAYKPAEKKTA
jgi:hypothetical protein